jgi:hypothetical protein
MTRQRVVIGTVVALFVAQAVVVIGWPYVRAAREARARERRNAWRAAQEGAICEAVAGYWMERESARSQGRATRFVVLTHAPAQTEDVVATLVKEGYDVLSHPPNEILPSDGPMLNLLNTMWSSDAEASVMTSTQAVQGDDRGGTTLGEYRLRLEHGAWRVVGEEEVRRASAGRGGVGATRAGRGRGR